MKESLNPDLLREELFEYLEKNPMRRTDLVKLLDISRNTIDKFMDGGDNVHEHTLLVIKRFLVMNENAA